MKRSIIEGLSAPDVQAVLNTYDLTSFYFPTLFPLQYTDELTWKSIEASAGAPVAADVISYDSRAPRKTRTEVSGARGDIPKIAIAREKTESEILKYHSLRRKATDGAKRAIADWIWDDQRFVFDGVNARLEWLALRAASTGKVRLTTQNNAGIVTEADVDFLVPRANKSGVTVPITAANAATSKPITIIKNTAKEARKKGVNLKYIFTDQDTIDNILISEETFKVVAPWVIQATSLEMSPTLEGLNRALKGMDLPIIVKIESFVTIEDKGGGQETVDPWEKGVMLFAESEKLGQTDHTDLADDFAEADESIKARRGHVLVKRYSTPEPLTEVTLGMANAFPVLGSPGRKYLIDSLHTSWTH